MPTLSSLVRRSSALGPSDEEWLHLLVGDWQMISDLSFADLLLWVPEREGGGFVAVAHARPSTGATVHDDDVVGVRLAPGEREQVDTAFHEGRICRERDPSWSEGGPVREETVPVVRAGRTIAVISRDTNLTVPRTPSRLEMTYLQCADALVRMICEGAFPTIAAGTGVRRGAPRVGDGLVRLDAEGVVLYASPNARSDFRRLGFAGELVGEYLAEITAGLIDTGHTVDETLPLVLMGRAPWRSDIENRWASLSLRAVPLTEAGQRAGALVLCRDVTELRRREQELITKDATIREIHHRVKNNLQTVSALLRLQARRIQNPEAQAALEEAMRRVSTIAVVHETLTTTLAQAVDFDEVMNRVLMLVAGLAAQSGSARVVREGEFGTVQADDATALALVVTELVTNAVEHGLSGGAGTVVVAAKRTDGGLDVTVSDDGGGIPEGVDPRNGRGLGLQIVRSLVEGELRGRIDWEAAADGGTVVRVHADLRSMDRAADRGLA